MIERWIPLAMLVTWSALLRWRIWIQKRRYGSNPVHLGQSGSRLARLRERAGLPGFYLLAFIALLVGLGRVDLAARDAQRITGIALGFGGALAMLSAQLNMGASWRIGIDLHARTPLVTRGWYRFCRNPIYLFMFASFVGFVLLVPNVWTCCLVAVMSLGFRAQTFREERWLLETYGDEWRAYAERVGRFVPLLGRIR